MFESDSWDGIHEFSGFQNGEVQSELQNHDIVDFSGFHVPSFQNHNNNHDSVFSSTPCRKLKFNDYLRNKCTSDDLIILEQTLVTHENILDEHLKSLEELENTLNRTMKSTEFRLTKLSDISEARTVEECGSPTRMNVIPDEDQMQNEATTTNEINLNEEVEQVNMENNNQDSSNFSGFEGNVSKKRLKILSEEIKLSVSGK